MPQEYTEIESLYKIDSIIDSLLTYVQQGKSLARLGVNREVAFEDAFKCLEDLKEFKFKNQMVQEIATTKINEAMKEFYYSIGEL